MRARALAVHARQRPRAGQPRRGLVGRGGPAHGRRDAGRARRAGRHGRALRPDGPARPRGRRIRPVVRAPRRARTPRRPPAGARARRWRPRTAACASAEGTAIDLGGIAKGWSAERALEAMRDAWPGMPGGLVDLGGDLALWGRTPEGGPWRVAVADPRHPGARLATLLVDGGGVATSGRDRRRFGPGRSLHHLIDPATGEPARGGPLTVTVVAPRGRTAPRRSRRCSRSATSGWPRRPWPRTLTSRRSSCRTPASPWRWARRASSGRPGS